MKKGLFINTRKANCSIYSSGLMLYESTKVSTDYSLDYVEIDKLNKESLHRGIVEHNTPGIVRFYDFYVFNYHHTTMRNFESINSRRFINLEGKKICIILEMNKNDPFPYMNPTGFDELLVLDPTMNRPEPNIHAFPRPLNKCRQINRVSSIPDKPLIGSFGYPTIEKGFHLIVKAASDEFETAHIRINISKGTYTEERFRQEIKSECEKYIRPGITLEFTDHYMNEDDLIQWCSENTINCFFYNRSIPGLAAATDQAIMSGAPLAVSDNTTFRHIHDYIKPYQQSSLKELILTSQDGIEKMQRDWSPESCAKKLFEIVSRG